MRDVGCDSRLRGEVADSAAVSRCYLSRYVRLLPERVMKMPSCTLWTIETEARASMETWNAGVPHWRRCIEKLVGT